MRISYVKKAVLQYEYFFPRYGIDVACRDPVKKYANFLSASGMLCVAELPFYWPGAGAAPKGGCSGSKIG